MRHYQVKTLVRWNQSQSEFEAFRREAAREIPWILIRFTVVIGLALWGFCIAMRRYQPEMPLNWVMVGVGLYAILGLLFMLVLPRWHRRPGEYRLTTRGIFQPPRRGQRQFARWSWLTGFYIEGDGHALVLLGKRRARHRIELPGDQRDEIILSHVRERLPEIPSIPVDQH